MERTPGNHWEYDAQQARNSITGLGSSVGGLATSVGELASTVREERRLEAEYARLLRAARERERKHNAKKQKFENEISILQKVVDTLKYMEKIAPQTTNAVGMTIRLYKQQGQELPPESQLELARNILNMATENSRKYFFGGGEKEGLIKKSFMNDLSFFLSAVPPEQFSRTFCDDDGKILDIARFFIRALTPGEITLLDENWIESLNELQLELMFSNQFAAFTQEQCSYLTKRQIEYMVKHCEIPKGCPLYNLKKNFLASHPEVKSSLEHKIHDAKSRSEATKHHHHHHHHHEQEFEEGTCCLVM